MEGSCLTSQVDMDGKNERKKRAAKAGSFGLPLWMKFGKMMRCIAFNARVASFTPKVSASTGWPTDWALLFMSIRRERFLITTVVCGGR